MVWCILRLMFVIVMWVGVKFNMAAVDFFVENRAVSKKVCVHVGTTHTGGFEGEVLGD